MFERLLRKYNKQYFGLSFHVEPWGFFSWTTYEVDNEKHFHIEDAYIDPELSKLTNLLDLYKVAEDLAVGLKCTHMVLSMDTTWSNFPKKFKILTEYFGFFVYHQEKNRVYLAKGMKLGGNE